MKTIVKIFYGIIVFVILALVIFVFINRGNLFWKCGSLLVDNRDGKSYKTILIGKQCWIQQNMNAGTMINGGENQGTDCSSIKKYCQNNDEKNCDIYGGLYQWGQTMCYSKTPGAKGICPSGWHVPTQNDFITLERAVCTSNTCTQDFPYNSVSSASYTTNANGEKILKSDFAGTNEGKILRSESGLFKNIPTAYRDKDVGFPNANAGGSNFWTSSLGGDSSGNHGPIYEELSADNDGIAWGPWDWEVGLSVRCVKN